MSLITLIKKPDIKRIAGLQNIGQKFFKNQIVSNLAASRVAFGVKFASVAELNSCLVPWSFERRVSCYLSCPHAVFYQSFSLYGTKWGKLSEPMIKIFIFKSLKYHLVKLETRKLRNFHLNNRIWTAEKRRHWHNAF